LNLKAHGKLQREVINEKKKILAHTLVHGVLSGHGRAPLMEVGKEGVGVPLVGQWWDG
jgi:hypothetical protein